MRVFIAIDVPDEIRSRLGELQQKLQNVAGAARWVSPESIHLTLKFIGEISEQKAKIIEEALNGLTWKPFPVKVQGVGFFPGKRSPRVFWAGLQAPTMAALAEKIDERLEPLGVEKEKRAFRPHVTLARAKDTRLDSALVAAAAAYEDEDFGGFIVDRCFLYESTLKPTGAVYTKLNQYLLAPAAGLREG